MMLVGAGMVASPASLTSSRVAGVALDDADSVFGLVGVAHDLGGALGLALLIVVFASANIPTGAAANVELAHRIGTAVSEAVILMALALVLVLVFVVRRPVSSKAGAEGSIS
jgi:hypothetical protein